MSTLSAPIEVFLSYTHADEPLCKKLENHLSQLRRDGFITIWHKRQIIAGTDWAKTLDQHLSTASVILLLVSSDFVASDYCYGAEMQWAIKRHEAGEARVIPILLRPVDWQSAPFGKLQVLPDNGTPITKWRNRDAAFTNIAQGMRMILQDIQHLAVNTSSAMLSHIWNIPYPRNPVFTGREKILTHLANTLKIGQAMVLSQPQAISGLGGIGKTQIAVEYAYQHCQDYQAVFWSLADTRESLISGYDAIARLLNLPEEDEQDQTTIKAVIQWLTTHTGWLLILDNADDLMIVREFVPSVFGGCILLTTRAQAMGRFAHGIEIDTMSQDIGALFLLRRALLIAPDALLEDVTASDVATAREICEELGRLPLALDQAGAYIEEVQCSLQDYLQMYRTHRMRLLRRRGGVIADHPEPVATTWSLSFNKIKQKSLVAADLLQVCAFLHPDAIPEEFLRQGAQCWTPVLRLAVTDLFLFDQAVEVLRNYSLLHRDPRTQTLQMHRLVQVVLKEDLHESTQKLWIWRTIRAMSQVFLEIELTTKQNYERFLPHALICADYIKQGQVIIAEHAKRGQFAISLSVAARLLANIGRYLQDRGQYVEAIPLYEQAMEILAMGSEGQDIYATIMNNWAEINLHQGEVQNALRKCQISLNIRKDLFQAGKISEEYIGLNYKTMAQIYLEAGHFIWGGERAKEAFEIFSNAGNQKDLATIYNYLGKIEAVKGNLQYAMEWFEKAQRASNGINIETYINSLNGQGRVFVSQGRWKEAQIFFEKAVIAAKEISHNYQQAQNLLDLAEVLEYLDLQQQLNQCLQEAKIISARWNYSDLLGYAEMLQGNFHYKTGNYQLAFTYYREYCCYMALRSEVEYNKAFAFFVDQLVSIPQNEVPSIVDDFVAYWFARNLDKAYPELKNTLQEVKEAIKREKT